MVSMDGTYAETGEQKTPGDKSQGEERQGDIYPSPVPLAIILVTKLDEPG